MRRGPALGLTSGLALAAIRGYQRWISPHKGFRCALRAVTGGDSCSSYGYLVIARFGLSRGLGLLDRRLELCGHVHGRSVAALAQAPRSPAVRNPWRHKEQGHCDVPCDSPGCDLPDLASCGCDIWDCGHSNRERSQRCWNRCGPGRRRHRDSTHLDALARRIAERRGRR
jgi:putative component of membrane protein insertase Oxa1/YidC/SpoIIIJ protein YidD